MARCVPRSGLLVLAFLLASCSGGGGGGGGGGGDGPRLNVSPTNFTFTATQNEAFPAAQEASVSISGGTVAVGIQSNGAGAFASAAFSITGQTTGKIRIAPFTTSLNPGTYTGVIVVRGCGDQVCASGDVAGSPVNINVSYTIRAQTGLRASPPSLSFTQVKGGPAPVAQTLGLSDTNNASYAWTASIQYQSATTGWLNISGGATASGNSLPDSLSVSIIPTTTVGTLNAVIHLTGNGKTLDVPVSYALNEPTLTRSPAQMTFSAAASGALPNTQNVTLSTDNNSPVDYTTSVVYGAGATGWLAVPATGTAPGSVTVGVNTTALGLGTYTATLTFATAQQMVSVNVTYTVVSSSISFTPGSASFAIGPTSLATDLSKTVAVGSTGVPLSWTNATSNQPWLSVSPTSGTTGSSVTLTIDRAQLESLDPGLQSATITFNYVQPGVGATSTPLSVTLNLTLPKISAVAPYVAISGTSREVILRGKGFNSAGGAALSFDSTSAPGYTVVSDTEIRVTPPSSLTAGTYRAKLANQLGAPSVVRSTADLVVVDAPIYAAASLDYPPDAQRTPLNVIYDAERQALLVAVDASGPGFGTDGMIIRYTFAGGLWSVSAKAPVAKFNSLGMSRDGKKLIGVSDTTVTPFDTVTLAPGTPTTVDLGLSLFFLNEIGMANDDNALITVGIRGSGFTDVYRYNVSDATLTRITGGGFFGLFNPRIGGSANGSRIVAVQNGISPAQPVFQYNASNGSLASTSLISSSSFPNPALDRNATRILLAGSELYNSVFDKLGNTPFHNTAVLSPDGTKAYLLGNGVDTKVHVFDLTATLTTPATDVFPEIGTGTPTPFDPGVGTRMTISPDGGTLFIVGDKRVVVMPTP